MSELIEESIQTLNTNLSESTLYYEIELIKTLGIIFIAFKK